MPEDLDRALVDDVGARRVGGATVPLDDKMAYAVPRQGDGQGQPGRPGPDDQDRHFDGLWTGNRHRPPPPRGITRRRVVPGSFAPVNQLRIDRSRVYRYS